MHGHHDISIWVKDDKNNKTINRRRLDCRINTRIFWVVEKTDWFCDSLHGSFRKYHKKIHHVLLWNTVGIEIYMAIDVSFMCLQREIYCLDSNTSFVSLGNKEGIEWDYLKTLTDLLFLLLRLKKWHFLWDTGINW